MKLVDKNITVAELQKMAKNKFCEALKVVVDVEKEIMVVDTELHADGEYLLFQNGSDYKNIWGISILPEKFGSAECVEFWAMTNLRPVHENFSCDIVDAGLREKIKNIFEKLVAQ